MQAIVSPFYIQNKRLKDILKTRSSKSKFRFESQIIDSFSDSVSILVVPVLLSLTSRLNPHSHPLVTSKEAVMSTSADKITSYSSFSICFFHSYHLSPLNLPAYYLKMLWEWHSIWVNKHKSCPCVLCILILLLETFKNGSPILPEKARIAMILTEWIKLAWGRSRNHVKESTSVTSTGTRRWLQKKRHVNNFSLFNLGLWSTCSLVIPVLISYYTCTSTKASF